MKKHKTAMTRTEQFSLDDDISTGVLEGSFPLCSVHIGCITSATYGRHEHTHNESGHVQSPTTLEFLRHHHHRCPTYLAAFLHLSSCTYHHHKPEQTKQAKQRQRADGHRAGSQSTTLPFPFLPTSLLRRITNDRARRKRLHHTYISLLSTFRVRAFGVGGWEVPNTAHRAREISEGVFFFFFFLRLFLCERVL
jgi:hypothetical protein